MRGEKYIFTEEQLKYIDENWGKETAHSMKLKFGCTWYAVVKAAETMGHEPPESNEWTDDDVKRLKELAEIHHYTVIAEMMGRSENAIYLKGRRLEVTLIMGRRKWTIEEEAEFSESWGTVSIETLAKKMKRTIFSLKVKAVRMKLGAMVLNQLEHLLISDIVDVLNVSRDRITTTWKKLGLNIKWQRVSKKKFYMYVTLEDLWDFLEKNHAQWDSRELEALSLGIEPDWLSEKRNQDRSMPPRQYREWTDIEIQRGGNLLLAGKDYEYIGVELERTPQAVAYKLREVIGSYKLSQFWKGRELIFLRDNYLILTQEEIGNELGRTTKAIGAKAEEMGYVKRPRKNQ